MTLAQYMAYEAKRKVKTMPMFTFSDGDTDEAALQRAIRNYCADNRWICFTGSMDEKTHRTIGEPDFHLLLPGGRVIHIECKTRYGKLTADQSNIAVWAASLGHTVHVVRSMKEFLAIVHPLKDAA